MVIRFSDLTRDEDEEHFAICKHPDDLTEPHTCPFAVDINDDRDTLCRCCENCQDDCAMEI